MKIATSLYRPGWHADLAALEGKLDGWVAEAAGQGGGTAAVSRIRRHRDRHAGREG